MLNKTSNLDCEMLLRMWEAAHTCVGVEREDALLDALDNSSSHHQSLGERNLKLIDLHALHFGDSIELYSRCPSCSVECEFSASSKFLTSQLRSNCHAEAINFIDSDGYHIEFRLPSRTDLEKIQSIQDAEESFLVLLERCVVSASRGNDIVSPKLLPEPVMRALSDRMEELDPGASISFALECPDCSTKWDALLNLGTLLWAKVQNSAERLLLDIDALARAYGWTEPDILRLSPLRRAAYLQLASI
jgi:hypothetical protein